MMAPRTNSPTPEEEEDRRRQSSSSSPPSTRHSKRPTDSDEGQGGGEASSQQERPTGMSNPRPNMRQHRQASTPAAVLRRSSDWGEDEPPSANAAQGFGTAFNQLSASRNGTISGGGGSGGGRRHPGIGPGNLRSSAMLQSSRRFSSHTVSSRRISTAGMSTRRLSVESQVSQTSHGDDERGGDDEEQHHGGDGDGGGYDSAEERAKRSVGTILKRLDDEKRDKVREAQFARRTLMAQRGAVAAAPRDRQGAGAFGDRPAGGTASTVAERVRRRRSSLGGSGGGGGDDNGNTGGNGDQPLSGELAVLQSRGRPSLSSAVTGAAGHSNRRAQSVPRNIASASSFSGSYKQQGLGRQKNASSSFDVDDFVVAPPSRSLGQRSGSSASLMGLATEAASSAAAQRSGRFGDVAVDSSGASTGASSTADRRPSIGQRWAEMALGTTDDSGTSGSRKISPLAPSTSRAAGRSLGSKSQSVMTLGSGGSSLLLSASGKGQQQQGQQRVEPSPATSLQQREGRTATAASGARAQSRPSLSERVRDMLRLDDETAAGSNPIHLLSSSLHSTRTTTSSQRQTSTSQRHGMMGTRSQSTMSLLGSGGGGLSGGGGAGGLMQRRSGAATGRRRASEDGAYGGGGGDRVPDTAESLGWSIGGVGLGGGVGAAIGGVGATIASRIQEEVATSESGSNDALDLFVNNKQEEENEEEQRQSKPRRYEVAAASAAGRGRKNAGQGQHNLLGEPMETKKKQAVVAGRPSLGTIVADLGGSIRDLAHNAASGEHTTTKAAAPARRPSLSKLATDLGGSIRDLAHNASAALNIDGAHLDEEIQSSRERERAKDVAARRSGGFNNSGNGGFSRAAEEAVAEAPVLDIRGGRDDATSLSGLSSDATSVTGGAAAPPNDRLQSSSSPPAADANANANNSVVDPGALRSARALARERRRQLAGGGRRGEQRAAARRMPASSRPGRPDADADANAAATSAAAAATTEVVSPASSYDLHDKDDRDVAYITAPVNFGDGGDGDGDDDDDDDDNEVHDDDPYARVPPAANAATGYANGRRAPGTRPKMQTQSSFYGSGDNLTVMDDERFKVVDGMIVLAGMDGSESPPPPRKGGQNEEWSVSTGGGGSSGGGSGSKRSGIARWRGS